MRPLGAKSRHAWPVTFVSPGRVDDMEARAGKRRQPWTFVSRLAETLRAAGSLPVLGRRLAVTLLAALTLADAALGVDPSEQLDDPALEARARAISKTLRCVVCKSQSIDDSDAPLAKDLRVLLRERLKAGDSDVQAVDYIAARYGDYVRLAPRAGLGTLALWAGPAAMFALGGLLIWTLSRRAAAQADSEDAGRPGGGA